MMSMKMPAGFSAGVAKTHMEVQWGLGLQRQKSVMVTAVTMQPASRLSNEIEAKKFFDEVAGTYASLAGIDLSSTTTESEDTGPGVTLDPAALDALTEHQKKLNLRQYELLGQHLCLDAKAADEALLGMKDAVSDIEAKLDLWITEHGEYYGRGILPKFTQKKVRVYDSWWNWVHDDVLRLHYDLLSGRVDLTDCEVTDRKEGIINRATPKTLDLLQHLISRPASRHGIDCNVIANFERQLLDNCRSAIDSKPLFKDPYTPTAPRTTVNAKGVIEYTESPKVGVSSFEEYTQEMVRSNALFGKHNTTGPFQYQTVALQLSDIKHELFQYNPTKPRWLPEKADQITPPEDDYSDPRNIDSNPVLLPFLHLKQWVGSTWKYSEKLSNVYMNALENSARSGVTFHGKTALITGTGAGSIGAMVLQGLIRGGASVITTTSNFSPEVTQY